MYKFKKHAAIFYFVFNSVLLRLVSVYDSVRTLNGASCINIFHTPDGDLFDNRAE